MRVLVFGGAIVAGGSALLRAQDPPAPASAFEVASIKQGLSNERTFVGVAPGRFIATNATLRLLVQFAYRRSNGRPLLNESIVGGPNWLDSDRFDLQAKIPGSAVPLEQVLVMVQSLLEDRFHLKTRRDTRDGPIFALVRVGEGRNLKISDDQTPVSNTAVRRIFDPKGPQPRGTLLPSRSGVNGVLKGAAVPMSTLAYAVEGYVNRTVIDATSLQGLFDLRLEFGPPPAAAAAEAAAPGAPATTVPADISAPVLPTALEEQLGLKLDPRRASVEVLVIDAADRPTID